MQHDHMNLSLSEAAFWMEGENSDMDFVGEMAFSMLEREVEECRGERLGVMRMPDERFCDPENQHLPLPLQTCSRPRLAPLSNNVNAHRSVAHGGIGYQGNGSPWIDGGLAESARCKGKRAACRCAPGRGTVCAGCAVRVVHHTLADNFVSYSTRLARAA